MKIRGLFLFISSLIFISGCKQPEKLKITDLKFVDYEAKAIADNHIDTMYEILMFKLSPYMDSDTFGFTVYNDSGKIKIEMKHELGGYYKEFKYDSIGLLRTKLSSTDYSSTARSSYEFFPDSLLFKQYWKDGDGRNTCTFRFNEKGLLIESVEYSNEQSSPYYHFKTLYEYNSKGQCIRKIVSTVSEYYEKWLRAHEKELGSRLSRGYTMELFYTGDKLDSTVKKYYFPTYPKQEYTSKTYYDERGLKYKTVDKDTLVTRYIHVRRK